MVYTHLARRLGARPVQCTSTKVAPAESVTLQDPATVACSKARCPGRKACHKLQFKSPTNLCKETSVNFSINVKQSQHIHHILNQKVSYSPYADGSASLFSLAPGHTQQNGQLLGGALGWQSWGPPGFMMF